ncbi:zinc ribbon domain-containing protein [Geobacillus stearothermophilus]
MIHPLRHNRFAPFVFARHGIGHPVFPCRALIAKTNSHQTYTCQCGYKRHRDIHGAMNLFAKVYYGEIRPLEFTVKPFTY